MKKMIAFEVPKLLTQIDEYWSNFVKIVYLIWAIWDFQSRFCAFSINIFNLLLILWRYSLWKPPSLSASEPKMHIWSCLHSFLLKAWPHMLRKFSFSWVNCVADEISRICLREGVITPLLVEHEQEDPIIWINYCR